MSKTWDQVEQLDVNNVDNRFAKHLLLKADRFYYYDGIKAPDDNFGLYFPRKDKIFFPIKFPIEAHEIAHMIEMPSLNRLLVKDWGLTYDAFSLLNKKFLVAFIRETRVRAIQTVIDDGSSNCDILKNIEWRDEIKYRLDLNPSLGKFTSFDQVKQWADSLKDKTIAHWNKDRIEFEWTKRVEFISNWMETK